MELCSKVLALAGRSVETTDTMKIYVWNKSFEGLK